MLAALNRETGTTWRVRARTQDAQSEIRAASQPFVWVWYVEKPITGSWTIANVPITKEGRVGGFEPLPLPGLGTAKYVKQYGDHIYVVRTFSTYKDKMQSDWNELSSSTDWQQIDSALTSISV